MSLIHKGQRIASNFITGDTLPIGSQIPFGSLTIPDNWLLCDGRAISRVDYSELFNVIGISYGAGNGTTTFNLPNKKGRTSVGLDTSQTEFNTIGKIGGSKELQEHAHGYYGIGGNNELSSDTMITVGKSTGSNFLKYTLSSGTGNSGNLQPYQADVWIIKAKQSAGIVATVVDNLTSTSPTNALSANMGRELNEILNEKTSVCTLRNSSDASFNFASAWVNYKYTFSSNHVANSNENIFEPYSGGIRVKKAGYYVISFSINTDISGQGTSAVLYINNQERLTNDCGNLYGMVNLVMPSVGVLLNANDVIYSYIRCSEVGNKNIRGGRSFLTVMKF